MKTLQEMIDNFKKRVEESSECQEYIAQLKEKAEERKNKQLEFSKVLTCAMEIHDEAE